MPRILLAFATALALTAATASTAPAQIVVYNGNVPSAPGVYVVNTPPFYNGLSFSNGVITAFPVAPPSYGYGYGYGSPFYRPVYPYPVQYPLYRPTIPGAWRP